MTTTPRLDLGAWRRIDASATSERLLMAAHHLVTHGVVVGMTRSGKTGLVTVMVEENVRRFEVLRPLRRLALQGRSPTDPISAAT